jgi:hypothetical protein
MHILFSAIATTAMFWRYRASVYKAIGIGVAGSLGICGVSDILLPYIGGALLGIGMHFHFCLAEHWYYVLPFALFGAGVGLLAKTKVMTIFSHSWHVLFSTMATLLYLISFGFSVWMNQLFLTFIIVFFGVIIPCCTSDILFPILAAKKK